jgi:hypothetical protein
VNGKVKSSLVELTRLRVSSSGVMPIPVSEMINRPPLPSASFTALIETFRGAAPSQICLSRSGCQ